jgi:hypothetical protein
MDRGAPVGSRSALAAATVGGDRAVAAVWAERAADEAMRRLAFEEAVRLYHVALDVGAADIDDAHRYRLLLSMARARHHCGEQEGTAQDDRLRSCTPWRSNSGNRLSS